VKPKNKKSRRESLPEGTLSRRLTLWPTFQPQPDCSSARHPSAAFTVRCRRPWGS